MADKQVSSIKSRINDLVQTLPEEDAPEAEESARDELAGDIRTSAISVRDRAHTLREWSTTFDDELMRRVSAAVNSTLEVLDSIRDLGLQEIGMRWAWMDAVTYKDWARYHALKAQLDDWRSEIHKVGMNQKSVLAAKTVANDILDNAMDVAENTAKELMRLKDVGHWKLAAREVSDNFDTRTEPPPPRPQPQPENEPEEESIDNDESTGTDEPVASSAVREEGDTSASTPTEPETHNTFVPESPPEPQEPTVDAGVDEESIPAEAAETPASYVDDSSNNIHAAPSPEHEL